VKEREVGLIPVAEYFVRILVGGDRDFETSILNFFCISPIPGQLKETGTCAEPDMGTDNDDELKRDFMRTWLSGRGIYVSHGGPGPSAMMEPLLPDPEVLLTLRGGNVNAERVEGAMSDFKAQLSAVYKRVYPEMSFVDGTEERLRDRMTVSSILSFVQAMAIVPCAMHQPTYVIHLGPEEVKLVLYGFVGGPVGGLDPSKKHTPYCVRISTQDLSKLDPAPIWNYVVLPTYAPLMDDCIEVLYE